MNFRLLVHTLVHLRPRQLAGQLAIRLRNPKLRPWRSGIAQSEPLRLAAAPIPRFVSRQDDGVYSFLNIAAAPSGWNDTAHGMLWAYNLNYMDYLNQPDLGMEDGRVLIERFISEIGSNKVGLDPYPIAVRGINWIKWLACHANGIEGDVKNRIDLSLRSQYDLLERKLEWHLMGNHLLEDAYSLVAGAVYFGDMDMWRRSSRLMLSQLREQTLADGAHYEQSPMYHCILLDRLLDVYNISRSNPRFGIDQKTIDKELARYAVRMLGHLESIVWRDGSIPNLNDSADHIAPSPRDIFDYARRLGLEWTAIPMKECGYRRFCGKRIEVIADMGGIAAGYQPGHSHADTFNFEMRVDGEPVIVDTGITTYDKTPRRQYERGTSAHNTVTVGSADSSEVWGGFRVARRARVTLQADDRNFASGSHDGFHGVAHSRSFEVKEDEFAIIDVIDKETEAVARLHLAPGERVENITEEEVITNRCNINFKGALKILVESVETATEYNCPRPSQALAIQFRGELQTRVTLTKKLPTDTQ